MIGESTRPKKIDLTAWYTRPNMVQFQRNHLNNNNFRVIAHQICHLLPQLPGWGDAFDE